MVIARWSGSATTPAFQAALRDPRFVEDATERALRGEDPGADARFGGRSERASGARSW